MFGHDTESFKGKCRRFIARIRCTIIHCLLFYLTIYKLTSDVMANKRIARRRDGWKARTDGVVLPENNLMGLMDDLRNDKSPPTTD